MSSCFYEPVSTSFESTLYKMDNIRFLIDVDGTSMHVTRVLSQSQTRELEIYIGDLEHHQRVWS